MFQNNKEAMQRIVYQSILGCFIYFWFGNLFSADWEKWISSVQASNGIGFGILIIDMRTATNTTDLPISFLFRAPTNTASELFILKDEYLARINLYDASNHPVKKTKMGAKYGTKFDKAEWGINKYSSQPHGPVICRDSWMGGLLLPKISELFDLREPGVYRLKVEAQAMLMYLDMSKKQVRQIVRFPPVEIMVTRPNSVGDSK